MRTPNLLKDFGLPRIFRCADAKIFLGSGRVRKILGELASIILGLGTEIAPPQLAAVAVAVEFLIKEVKNEMKALRNLACTAFMAAVICASAGVATAETDVQSNHQMAPGVWYTTWMGPENLEFGTPDAGVTWQKDFTGEVVYVDGKYMSVDIDGSEDDIANFYLYENLTQYTPSFDAIRVGSKIEVRADNRNRVRSARTIPFYQWLENQSEK